jgi:prevent-host-death family protein
MCYFHGVEQIGIRELRQHASQWIAKVRSGVAIQITDRGRPVAQLVPITTADHDREALIAGSQLIPAPNPRQPLSTDDLIEGPSLSAILDELRADR